MFCLTATDSLRTVEVEEVNKMLSCKDESRGYSTYQCESGAKNFIYANFDPMNTLILRGKQAIT